MTEKAASPVLSDERLAAVLAEIRQLAAVVRAMGTGGMVGTQGVVSELDRILRLGQDTTKSPTWDNVGDAMDGRSYATTRGNTDFPESPS